ncbi:Wall-associated receptor kinase-like 18 [Camellia lanceoleosa]|uniref:Wall-associated receptor kinase-like 18 n=1 Tax=Camellia lanceoleosa TaxID=1840588 RepID=A0ACC0HFN8_9ERIC|nr:Wall-associated receptor kinase-like 18 [Camellia lanceoleosa]
MALIIKQITSSSFTLLFLLMLLWLTNTSAYRYTQDGCPTWCGNVRIPFPFGIGVNCSLNEWYSIECRVSNRSSDYSIEVTAYLTNISLEVLDISLRGGYVLVNHPVISPNCSVINNGSSSVDLTDSPFQFSAYFNSFVAVGAGCDNQEAMMLTDLLDNKKNMPITSCTLTCNSSTNTISSCTSPLISEQSLQGYKVNLASRGKNNQSGGGGVVQTSCTYGFLYNNVTQSVLQFHLLPAGLLDDNFTYSTFKLNELSVGVQNKTITHVPVLLDWIVPASDLNVSTPTSHDKYRDCFPSSNAVSSSNGRCKIVKSWTCYCKFSSMGNPYLLDGCKGTYMLNPSIYDSAAQKFLGFLGATNQKLLSLVFVLKQEDYCFYSLLFGG